MTSVAGRKKSIVGVNGIPAIDIPHQNNTLLNKSASHSTSLYQQCSQLRARLLRIRDFPPFLDVVIPQDDFRKSTDMVHDLWDHLQLGIPLVFLFNLLPPPAVPIDIIDTNPHNLDVSSLARKDKQKAIAYVNMAINKLEKQGHWAPNLNFTVSDLLDTNTNGFVKVVQTLTYLVGRLPSDVFIEDLPPSPPSNTSQSSFHSTPSIESDIPQEVERKNIIREMLETERKYVQDLEVMQTYATALLQNHIIDQDTIHHLFPGLNKLLDFQRKFLISMEQIAEHSWKEQAWGLLFTNNEEEFEVYEPYCANYTNATELMLAEEQNLMTLADVINPKSELPAFLIKPVQRICKYPLLLDSLLKKSSKAEYPLYNDLVEGSAAAKRVTDKINEAQRRAENIQTVQTLQTRVEDWKGHHLANFGDLLLDDIFLVTKSEVDRDYHVFLFEKIILCCKEAVPTPHKKGSKNNSILKKPSVPATPLTGGSGLSKKRNTPLLLKGRIFLNNVTRAARVPVNGDPHALRVYWRGDDDTEYFTLRCRSEEQLKQWEGVIMRLVNTAGSRRQSERSTPNSTSPAPHTRHSSAVGSGYHEKSLSVSIQSPSYQGASMHPRFPSPYRPDLRYGSESKIHSHPYPSAPVGSIYPGSVGGLVKHPYGDETLEVVDDDLDEYPHARPNSGRGTPLGGRRAGDPQSMPPERDVVPGYERPRAKTEDINGAVLASWRNHGHPVPPPPPPPVGSIPPPPGASMVRPSLTASRNGSDGSFGPGAGTAASTGARAGQLRSKFSTTRLKSAYDEEHSQQQPYSSFSRSGSQASITGGNPGLPVPGNGPTRARSSSTPSTYTGPKPVPPPLPTSQWNANVASHAPDRKRGSGSSQSTGDSSDYSPPQTVSPITPFGSNDSSLASATAVAALRSTRSAVFTGPQNDAVKVQPPMRVKVHFGEDLFVISVPRSTEYEDLVEKVGKKIRLCGGRRTGGPLRVKYQDEDGDFVSLSTTEDVQLAFDMAGGALTLYVA